MKVEVRGVRPELKYARKLVRKVSKSEILEVLPPLALVDRRTVPGSEMAGSQPLVSTSGGDAAGGVEGVETDGAGIV